MKSPWTMRQADALPVPTMERVMARIASWDPSSGSSATTGDRSALIVVEKLARQARRNVEYEQQQAGELALSQGRRPVLRPLSPFITTGTLYRLRYSEALTGRFADQAAHVAAVATAHEVTHGPMGAVVPVHTLVDATGLGAPLVEEVRTHGVPAMGLVWAAFAGLAPSPGVVAKGPAFGRLRLILEKARLEIAEDLPDRETLVSELTGLRLETSESGHQTIKSPSGGHDDFASALVLALVFGEGLDSSDPADWPTVHV